jgi:ketosteroid isomerase-like protein
LPKLYRAFFLVVTLSAQHDLSLTEQVRRAEIAFAKTMADRDHAAFTSFLAKEAIFVSPHRVLRGAREVAAGWKKFYEGPQAETAVLRPGLALSPDGRCLLFAQVAYDVSDLMFARQWRPPAAK